MVFNKNNNTDLWLRIFLWTTGVLFLINAALSIVRYTHYHSGGYDLGIFDQALWQYSRFLFPFNSIKDMFILGDHLTLSLPLLAPLYWIVDDARMLLLFQVGWLSFSSIAVFLLARRRGFSSFTSFFLGLLYHAFYGIQVAIFTDFNPVFLGVGLLPWIAYAIEYSKIKLMYLAIFILLLTKENMGIALICLSLFYIFDRKYRRLVVGLVIAGCIWTVIALFVLQKFSPHGYDYFPEIPNSFGQYITRFFDDKRKIDTLVYSFGWFGFLPLLSPIAVLAVVIDLSQYFVTGHWFERTWSPLYVYRSILGIYLFLGTLSVLEWVKSRRKYVGVLLLCIGICAGSIQWIGNFPLNRISDFSYWQRAP